MQLSPEQQRRFWREWSAICAAHDYAKDEIEPARKALLARAGFDSLTHVDKVAGFTKVLHELAAAKANLGQMLNTTPEANARRVLYHAIAKYGRKITPSVVDSAPFKNPYIFAVMQDRFGHHDPERLDLRELEQLRNTLAARATEQAKQRRADKAQAKAPKAAPPAIKFYVTPEGIAHPVPATQTVECPF